MSFSLADLSAFAYFLACWIGYGLVVESLGLGRRTLNHLMHDWRQRWMVEMVHREVRIVDTQIMASLQNGTAFFASTSLIAVGGALTLLRTADDIVRIFSDLPFGIATSRALWETKAIGLSVIFVYAFFKFAWSYRLFNYAAILLGATPPYEEADSSRAHRHAERVATMTTVAGTQFNRGQRALFMALGYFGWFVSPLVFVGTATAVVLVMGLRQYWASGMLPLMEVPRDDPTGSP